MKISTQNGPQQETRGIIFRECNWPEKKYLDTNIGKENKKMTG